MLLARVPSTETTSPCLIRMRSPGTTASSLTSSSSAPRCRMVVRGTRDRSGVISRRARRSAKLSRYWPPAYITATTTPASSSPKASAALIESAATMSRPKSPLRRLETISKRRVSNTGNANGAQTKRDHSASPSGRRAKPRTRPVVGNRTRSGRRRMPRDGEFGLSLTPTYPSHLGANLPEDAIHPLNLADVRVSLLIGSSLRPSVRQRAHPARQRILSTTRRRGPSGSQQFQSLRGQQLDAIEIQAHLSDLYMQNESPGAE